MSTTVHTVETLAALARQLPPAERARLIERVAASLAEEPPAAAGQQPKQPLRSLYGLWADLNVDISAEDIDQARKEMWGNFPREDIA
jgi:hypothetical protein